MKALGLSVALAALLVSAPTDGVAQTDLSGSWILVIGAPTPGSGTPFVLRLRVTIMQDGQAITASGVAGNAGPFEMTGSIEESAVQLLWEADFGQGPPREFRFTGTATENDMSGSVDIVSVGGTVTGTEWSAARED